MALWARLVLGSLALILIAQVAAGSQTALRARRWSTLVYLPLMLVAALDVAGRVDVPMRYLWSWAAVTLMFDQLVSDSRLGWRNRRHRDPIA